MNEIVMLEANRLTVRYGSVTAVDKVCLKVERGSVYALLGRNGAGKSSLVRAALGQVPADEGQIRILGMNCWRQRSQVMARVGAVPESLDIPPGATARHLASYLSAVTPGWDPRLFFDRLSFFGVDENRSAKHLSKGQQRWLGLAMALASSPELVILDDPTLGLDVVAREALFVELIGELSERGATVLITTHDLRGVEGIATHVGILEGGHLGLSESIDDLKFAVKRIRLTMADSVDPSSVQEIASLVGIHDLQQTGRLLTGVTRAWDGPELDRLSTEAGVESVKEEALPLEEIFLHLCRNAKGVRS